MDPLRSNFRSVASIRMKNLSSVTRRKRDTLNTGWCSRGRRLNAHTPKNVVKAENKTVSSNITGTLGGIDQFGLPEIFSGYPDSTYRLADCVNGLFTYH